MLNPALTQVYISIHALREEGDASAPHSTSTPRNFYPRPPRGGRRRRHTSDRHPRRISIHALREEGDVDRADVPEGVVISIHALREEGDTDRQIHKTLCNISIHALREEGDSAFSGLKCSPVYFYPRPPRGGRHAGPARLIDLLGISIHALREEGDIEAYIKPLGLRLFLSTPSARRATMSGPW